MRGFKSKSIFPGGDIFWINTFDTQVSTDTSKGKQTVKYGLHILPSCLLNLSKKSCSLTYFVPLVKMTCVNF